MIGTTGRHDNVIANTQRFVVSDFRIGIGQGEDNRMIRHGSHHFLGYEPSLAQAQKHIRSFHSRLQVFKNIVSCVFLLRLDQPLSSGVDVPSAIKNIGLLGRHPQLFIQIQTAHRSSTGATDYHPDVFDVFASQFQRIQQGC